MGKAGRVKRGRKRREYENEISAAKRSAGLTNHVVKGRIDDSRAIRPTESDTRDLTARMMGDPLPGRSALDQR